MTLFLKILEIELTLGTLFLSQTPSASSRSRISHAKIPAWGRKDLLINLITKAYEIILEVSRALTNEWEKFRRVFHINEQRDICSEHRFF